MSFAWLLVNAFVTHYFQPDARLFNFIAMKTLVLNMIGMYWVSQKTPKTIENDLLLEFQCLALN